MSVGEHVRPIAAETRPHGAGVDLRARLAAAVGGALRDAEVELYVTDAHADLAPVPERGVVRLATRKLLGALRARALADRRDLTEPCAFPSLPELGGAPAMGAPLVDDGGEFVGLVALHRKPGAPPFTPEDLRVLQGLAALVAPAVRRACPRERSLVRRRELDLRAASGLQRRLMSGALPEGIGVTAVVAYRPALDVGGDFYSLRYLGGGRLSVAIGDVSGNGISAALLMSRVASDVERALGSGALPSAVLGTVNADLALADSDRFVTASCVRLDTVARTATMANAGHLPIVVCRSDGEAFTFGGASGTPLGVAACEYEDEDFGLEPGDIVLLATDGLLEVLDHPSGFRGLERLVELVREAPHDVRAVHARLSAAVESAALAHDLDDVTWVGLQLAT